MSFTTPIFCPGVDEVKNFDMKVFLAFQRVAFSDGVMETVMEKGNLDELFEEEQE